MAGPVIPEPNAQSIRNPNFNWDHGAFYVENAQLAMANVWVFRNLRKDFSNEDRLRMYTSIRETITNVYRNQLFTKITDPLMKMQTLEKFSEITGWGKAKFFDLNPEGKEVKIKIYNSPEVVAGSNEKTCLFMRAHIAGILRGGFGWEGSECIEAKCASEGYEFCEFHAMPYDKLNFDDGVVKEQIPRG